MITRDEARLLFELDATLAEMARTETTWRENAEYYAVITSPRDKHSTAAGPFGHRGGAKVVFVNKASGQVQHAPYAVVSVLLEAMRPVEATDPITAPVSH